MLEAPGLNEVVGIMSRLIDINFNSQIILSLLDLVLSGAVGYTAEMQYIPDNKIHV